MIHLMLGISLRALARHKEKKSLQNECQTRRILRDPLKKGKSRHHRMTHENRLRGEFDEWSETRT
jgi:hypothetical protein